MSINYPGTVAFGINDQGAIGGAYTAMPTCASTGSYGRPCDAANRPCTTCQGQGEDFGGRIGNRK